MSRWEDACSAMSAKYRAESRRLENKEAKNQQLQNISSNNKYEKCSKCNNKEKVIGEKCDCE